MVNFENIFKLQYQPWIFLKPQLLIVVLKEILKNIFKTIVTNCGSKEDFKNNFKITIPTVENCNRCGLRIFLKPQLLTVVLWLLGF